MLVVPLLLLLLLLPDGWLDLLPDPAADVVPTAAEGGWVLLLDG